MTLPALVFGVLLAALYAAIFHFWKADSLKRLLLYLLLSEVGFWGGHTLASVLNWVFASVGPLHAGLATLGSALFLFVGRWLSQVEIERK
jgi:ABC-type Na+ efflux pump permease subunit